MAIIGNNATASAISLTSTSPQVLSDHATYRYQSTASQEVFRLSCYIGANVGDGTGVTIAVYDLGTGPATDGATKICEADIATLTGSAWNTVAITPVALTENNYYAVAVKVNSATNVSLHRAVLTGGVNRHATLTGAAEFDAVWDEGTDLGYTYSVYAETQAASSTITDVDTDETIVPGQTGVVVTGTNLSSGASARWVDANANVLTMANYSAHATTPTFDVPSLATTLAAGVKFGSGTFEILDGGSVSVATLAVALGAPSGWQVHDVTDISQAADEGCLYYGLSPAVAVGDQILLSDTVTIDSQGFLEFPPGVTSINYYVFDETDDTWGTMGTFSVIVSNDGYAVKSTVRDAVRSVVRNILN